MRRLYEVVTEDGCAISPYAWRSRYALAHKGLEYDARGLGFTDIPAIGPGTFKAVPVLEDGDHWIGDSWAIACYLDEHYPSEPSIFSSAAEYATLHLVETWLLVEVVSRLFRICALDIHDRLRPVDRPHYRQTREARLEQPLEAAHRQRGAQVAPLREALKPLRLALRARPFLGGEAANYADFMTVGIFIWAGSVATLPLLDENDPLLDWIERALNLYGGIGDGVSLPGMSRAAR